MTSRQQHFESSSTSFFKSHSHFPSKIDPSKMTNNNSYLSFLTDVEETPPQLSVPQNVLTIISKKQNQRTSSENVVILKYLIKKTIFRFLIQKLTMEVVKNMIKQGNIKIYSQGEIFIFQTKKVKSVNILLIGEAVVIDHEQDNLDKEEENNDIGSMLDHLIEKLGRETKKFKIKTQNNNKKNSEMEKSLLFRKETITTDNMNLQQFQILQPECFLDFQALFNYEPKHLKTIAAKTLIAVFTLPLEVFYQSLLHNYYSKLNQKLKLFRRISIFDFFQNSKLRTLIQKLQVVQMKKNQYVYREGEQPKCFYMLIQGQVQISKTIDIFNENPNNFYKNRIKVSRQRMNRQLKILPYANFNGVYNYKPQQKIITLAQINPICIFGEEEILDNKTRQVNAKILSLHARLYQIHLEDIEELCNKMIGANGEKKITLTGFLSMMEENVTLKKILFRQNQLSDLVHYQNKNKYSTLFETRSAKKSKSYMKTMFQSKIVGEETEPKKTIDKLEQAPPQFNNFNFTDFMNDGTQQFGAPVSQQLNEDELKVVKLTHVKYSDPSPLKSRQKSIRLRSFSKQRIRNKLTNDNLATIDSMNNTITIQQPLFTINYFEKQHKDQKILYVQAKKKRLQNIYKNLSEKMNRS